MALTFAVENVFKAKEDDVTQAFRKMARGADNFEKASVAAFKKSSKQASQFGTIVKGILTAGVIQKGFGLMTQGVQMAGRQFLDFDQAITAAGAKFTDVNLATEEGRQKMEELRKTARMVGRDTEHNAAQAAGGLDFLAMAGFNANQSIALLPGVANLATSANIDFARATDIASDALGAFGKMSKDTEVLTKNFVDIQDMMARVTTTSNTNLEQFFETIQSGAPDFVSAGQSMYTFGTLAAEMANSGLKGEKSGVRLRNMVTKLAKPTKEATDELKRLGVRVKDQYGNFRDFLDIVDDLRVGTKKLGEVERAKALATIFDSRNTGALNIIMKQTDKQLKSYRQSLIDSQGASQKMAEIMRSSLMNRLKSLGSAATELGFQLFDAFDEKGANAIERFTSYLRGIDLSNVIKNLDTGLKYLENWATIGSEILGIFTAISKKFNILEPPEWFKKLSFAQKDSRYPSNVNTGIEMMEYDIDNYIKPFFKNLKYDIESMGKDKNAAFGTPEGMRTRKMNLNEIAQTHGSVASLKSMLGFGPEYTVNEQIQRPQTQRIDIGGTLNIAGAPEGSTYKPSSSAPPIDTRFTAPATGL